jgi:integrase
MAWCSAGRTATRCSHSTTAFTQDTYQHVTPRLHAEAAAVMERRLRDE